jgi:hypothetical protein
MVSTKNASESAGNRMNLKIVMILKSVEITSGGQRGYGRVNI